MQKLTCLLLSLLLLTGSTGIAYGQHFCGGFLVKSGFVASEVLLSCGMEKASGCEKTVVSSEKHCCDNDLYQVDTDDHYSGHAFQLKIPVDFQVAVLAPSQYLSSTQFTTSPLSAFCHDPPPIIRDICLEHQVFLI